ncbi:MAG: hypothetical protein ACR2PA_15245 [Hyphomicrobiaceae bacterium]
MTAPTARILRGGTQHVVLATELVPGDIVPADLRLTEAVTLRTDESMLTGELIAIDKRADCQLSGNAQIGDRVNMAFKGTNVAHGQAVGVAAATGMATELGRIAGMLDSSSRLRTPLQRHIARFGRFLGFAVIVLSTVIFPIGLLRGEEPILMFLTAIGLAVAAVPEALPAVVTVALAREQISGRASATPLGLDQFRLVRNS